MLLVIIFLAGVVLYWRFNAWGLVLTTSVLVLGQIIWLVIRQTPVPDALLVVAAQTVLLQAGYFFGLLIAYARTHLHGARNTSEGKPPADVAELPHGVARIKLKLGIPETDKIDRNSRSNGTG